MTHSLIKLFLRDLDRIAEEINLYPSEDNLRMLDGEIKNSAGTLCLHICGNLQHFIGAILGNSGYKRDRDAEFNNRNISKDRLLDEIEKTKEVVERTLIGIGNEHLSHTYPLEMWNTTFTIEFFLIHLYGHLNWHYGQINYHRRLLDQEK